MRWQGALVKGTKSALLTQIKQKSEQIKQQKKSALELLRLVLIRQIGMTYRYRRGSFNLNTRRWIARLVRPKLRRTWQGGSRYWMDQLPALERNYGVDAIDVICFRSSRKRALRWMFNEISMISPPMLFLFYWFFSPSVNLPPCCFIKRW